VKRTEGKEDENQKSNASTVALKIIELKSARRKNLVKSV